jgi:hypothetical protein
MALATLGVGWSSASLAGTVTIEGNLERDEDADFVLFDVVAADITEDEKLKIEETPDKDSLINIFLKEEPKAIPPEATAADDASFVFSFSDTVIDSEGQDNDKYTLIFHLRVDGHNEKLSTIIDSGKLVIAVGIVLDGSTIAGGADKKTTLLRSDFVINQAPSFVGAGVTGTQQSLVVTWDPVSTLTTKGENAKNVKSTYVSIFVVDTDLGSVNLDASKFVQGSSLLDDPAVCNVATVAGSCACPNAVDTYILAASAKQLSGITYKRPEVSAGKTTISGLVNNHNYTVFMQFEPGGVQRSECLIGTPIPNYSMIELNKGPKATTTDMRCFIATAAYGSPLHKDIDLFRSFRDQVLLRSAIGRTFVDFYYRFSPPLADFIAAHPYLRAAARYLLEIPAALLRPYFE